MSIRRRFVLDTLGTGVAHVLLAIKGLLIIPIVTKTAGTAVFGGYSLVVSALTVLVGVSSLGTWARLRRFLPSEPGSGERGALFYPQFGFHLSFSLVWVAIAALVVATTPLRFGDLPFSPWLVAVYVAVSVLFIQLPNYFRYTNRVAFFNVPIVLAPYLFVGLVLVGVAIGASVSIDRLLMLEAAATAIVMLPLAFVLFRELGIRFEPYAWGDLVADVRLGFPLVAGLIMDFLLAASDRFLIALFISVAAVGQYVPAYALGSCIIMLAKIGGVVLPPLLANLVDSGNEKEASVLVNFFLKAFSVVAIPFFVGTLLLSYPLLRLFANEEVARQAADVTPIVALASIFYGLCLILDNVLFVRLKTAALFRATSIAVGVNIGLNVLLLPIFEDIHVAAFTTLVGYITMFAYVTRVAATQWQFAFEYRTLAKSLAAALAMGAVVWALKHWLGNNTGAVWLVAEIVVGVVVYGAVAVALRIVSGDDRALLGEISRRRA